MCKIQCTGTHGLVMAIKSVNAKIRCYIRDPVITFFLFLFQCSLQFPFQFISLFHLRQATCNTSIRINQPRMFLAPKTAHLFHSDFFVRLLNGNEFACIESALCKCILQIEIH